MDEHGAERGSKRGNGKKEKSMAHNMQDSEEIGEGKGEEGKKVRKSLMKK